MMTLKPDREEEGRVRRFEEAAKPADPAREPLPAAREAKKLLARGGLKFPRPVAVPLAFSAALSCSR